jgi:hypothetical protein
MYATTLPRSCPSLPGTAAARRQVSPPSPIRVVDRDLVRGAEQVLFAVLFAGFVGMAASFLGMVL